MICSSQSQVTVFRWKQSFEEQQFRHELLGNRDSLTVAHSSGMRLLSILALTSRIMLSSCSRMEISSFTVKHQMELYSPIGLGWKGANFLMSPRASLMQLSQISRL